MREQRLGPGHAAAIVLLAVLTLGTALGRSRLSYHEAICGQSAREMIAGGDPAIPTIDGRPWLEKPPLGIWLIAALGWLVGGVDEVVARLPSVVSASILCLVVANLAARRFGSTAGLLAGCVQATSAWLVTRGRLADVDILLAALVASAISAFDAMRVSSVDEPAETGSDPVSRLARGTFFLLLGVSSMVKGIGFGAAVILATVVVVLAWDRDKKTLRRLVSPVGWSLAALLTMAWPLVAMTKHSEAPGLWAMHVVDRLAARSEHFAGEPWGEYALSLFWQTLPWTPLALLGAFRSAPRARREPSGPDRLLWAWAVAPAILVSLASVRNGHYLIHALPPWSIWASLALIRLGERLRGLGRSADRVRRSTIAVFAGLGVVWAIAWGLVAPRFDRRASEWAFYESAGRLLGRDEPLILLYDWPDWDRFPYPTPFGPMPHDLAVRLFYLDRPASWRVKSDSMPSGHFAIIARRTDVDVLRKLGRVEVVADGPTTRWDRAYRLYRVERNRQDTMVGHSRVTAVPPRSRR